MKAKSLGTPVYFQCGTNRTRNGSTFGVHHRNFLAHSAPPLEVSLPGRCSCFLRHPLLFLFRAAPRVLLRLSPAGLRRSQQNKVNHIAIFICHLQACLEVNLRLFLRKLNGRQIDGHLIPSNQLQAFISVI